MPSPYTLHRVACLQPSASVILHEIGELERIVACTRYCLEVVPSVADRFPTILADSWTANAAEIAAVRPDLVIAAVPYQEKSVSEILKAGIRFLGLSPKSLDDIYTDIATIAGTVAASERGESVILSMQKQIDDARGRCGSGAPPRVFCEEWGKPIIASQPWVAELVKAAGGIFVGTPGTQHSERDVRQMNPDVLIAAWCGAGDRVPLEKIVGQRGWEGTRAAQSGRIFCIRDEFLNTPAPTLLRGLNALCWAIHPEVSPQPEGIRQITGIAAVTAENSIP